MIKIVLTNDIVKRISAIDENRFKMNTIHIPHRIADHLRKISKKKSSYASNKIEGNPLSEQQADEVVEQDPHRHFLKFEITTWRCRYWKKKQSRMYHFQRN